MPILDFTIPFEPFHPRVNYTGQTFHYLTVLSIYGRINKRTLWLCQCRCGTFITTRIDPHTNNSLRSCGCDFKSSRHHTHGMSGTQIYSIFNGAWNRCNNPTNPGFPAYGGRGIKFLFETPQTMSIALGPRPSPTHTMDRIDNDGHYEPGNVRWATKTEQIRNRRCTKTLTLNGVTKTMIEWAGNDISQLSALRNRLQISGWCVECAITLAKHGRCNHRTYTKRRWRHKPTE